MGVWLSTDPVTRNTVLMTRNRWCRSAALAFALALWPNLLAAQTEGGVTRDPKTGAPLECLHVSLVDSTNRAVAQTITDTAGRFQLEAPHPGPYRVRFELYGWEPLTGPVDTLADGDFKQRRYPVDFVNLLMPKLPLRSILDTAESVHAQHDREENEAYVRLERELRGREDPAVWRSRMLNVDFPVEYPADLRKRGLQGAVVAQFIVDAYGRLRTETWQPIRIAHKDFEKSVRSKLADMRWTPAILEGRPVCELTRSVVLFSLDYYARTEYVRWSTRLVF